MSFIFFIDPESEINEFIHSFIHSFIHITTCISYKIRRQVNRSTQAPIRMRLFVQ